MLNTEHSRQDRLRMYTEQLARYMELYREQYPGDEIRWLAMAFQAVGSWEEDFSTAEVVGVIQQLIKEGENDA